MLHLIYSMSSWAAQHPHGHQRHGSRITRKLSTCCGRGTQSVPPDLVYRSACRNLEMPPLLHVPQSTRPQPFPAPPWLHTFLVQERDAWV